MSLRVRLILAFLALSVVPLGAMTWYNYASSERALRGAAVHESDMLASELSQRMQSITAQLSERVDRLMDLDSEGPAEPAVARETAPGSSETTAAAAPSATTSAPSGKAKPGEAPSSQTAANTTSPSPPPAPVPGSVSVPTVTISVGAEGAIEAQVADRLGDAAMLLNNVEIRGLPPRPDRGRGRGPNGRNPGASGSTAAGGTSTPGPPRSGGRGAGARGSSPASRGSSPTPRPTPASPDGTAGFNRPPRPPTPPSPPAPLTTEGAASTAAASNSSTAATSSSSSGGSGTTAAAAAAASGERITIDLAGLWREMFQEIAPGRTFEEMDGAERMRVIAEINQRLLGIRQGLRLGAAELQKQAEEAKRASATGPLIAGPPAPASPPAASSSRAATPVASPRAATPSATARAATPLASPRSATAPNSPTSSGSAASGPAAPAPAASAPGVAAAPAPASKPVATTGKAAALSGNRLNVRREKNGVVRQVNAEVNLPRLLTMVFSNTPRDRGEVPFALDKSGRVYAPNATDRKAIETMGGGVADFERDTQAMQLPEWIVVTTADPSGSGLKFGIARPVGGALNEIRKTAVRSAGLGLLFISGTLLLIVPLSTGLTRNLSRLSAGVHQIAKGDYAARVPVKTRDEIGQLALAFNQMAEDVEKHQRTAIGQERIKRELELGREIQHDMLPGAPLRIGQTEARGVSAAAGEVGGDFFNYFALKDGRIALLVGDVAGKGVGAALLMANLQASLRTRLTLGQDLTALANEVDADIQANTPETVYSTLFVGTLDPSTRILRYVNAGHNPQYVLRRRGGLERLESSGLPVGLIAGRGYTEGQTQLEAGDVVFCYTDGCVEAENPKGDMFGNEALEHELLTTGPLDPEALLQRMEEVLQKFRDGRDLFDDATMMVVKAG